MSLYFKQLLAGRDFATQDQAASQMENFVYLVGDSHKKECAVIDAAWDIDGIIAIANNDDMKITHALATHYHPDHVGGSIFGHNIEGLTSLISKNPCFIHAHSLEKSGLIKVTSLSNNDILSHNSGDILKIGDIEITMLHTPGHTPGSLCFKVKNMLLSGDTLFLNGCGRVDLPGGNVEQMYETIHQKLSKLADDIIIFPGHAYGGEYEAFGQLKQHNPIFKYFDKKSFMRFFTRA